MKLLKFMKMVESIKLRRDLVDFVASQGDVVVLKKYIREN